MGFGPPWCRGDVSYGLLLVQGGLDSGLCGQTVRSVASLCSGGRWVGARLRVVLVGVPFALFAASEVLRF